jgi:ketosteroid isomerase-like protein
MKSTLAVLALALMTQAPSVAAQQTAEQKAALAVVNQFIDGFNKGDVPAALATCAEQTSIIDEIPPFEWSGAGACGKWAADYDADAKKKGITAGAVTMGTPRHNVISGDRAYLVIPTSYDVTQNGKPVKQTGAVMAVTLRKGAAGWKITAWSWSTGSIR